MPKYGRGLNREIVAAVNSGELREPLTMRKVWDFVKSRHWETTPSYIAVCLANGESKRHSLTYRKYFEKTGEGEYRVQSEFRGPEWK